MNTVTEALEIIDTWRQAEWLRPLDAAFARFLATEVTDAPPALLMAAALASHQLGRGHVCLDLAATLDDPRAALSLPPPDRWAPDDPMHHLPAPPDPREVLGALNGSSWQKALIHPLLVADAQDTGHSDATPLVLDAGRLYLRRYWRFENTLAAGIAARLEPTPSDVDPHALRAMLDTLFGNEAGETEPNWQKIACAIALRTRFSIITGGPGTGKTTTVLALLALLQASAMAAGDNALRIHLAAPTGKAAARLNESIAERIDQLPLTALGGANALADSIPSTVTTLHRLLGFGGAGRRRHDAQHPLPLDVLVIDEASMVDLEMMAAVVEALPAEARLILLGDRDQLASVEAGAVLGELCARAEQGRYQPATADWLAQVSGEQLPEAMIDAAGQPLDQAIVMLRQSHRFAGDSAIGQLARAMNAGQRPRWLSVDQTPPEGVAILHPESATADAWRDKVIAGSSGYLQRLQAGPAADNTQDIDAWAAAILAERQRFQVLAALRNGPWGVVGLNSQIEAWLVEAGLIQRADVWYAGRPVMMTRNDYALGLMNGDVGITLKLPEGAENRLRVAFPDNRHAGGVRWVSPLRLAHAETVHAMTVHKSQGSEFAEVALVLPPGRNPLLTRELLYTGVTRARQAVTLVLPGGPGALMAALGQRVRRASGLNARLWRA